MLNDVAITDALLAIVAGVEGFRLLSSSRGGPTAGVGLLMVALAAGFGALRFTIAPDLEMTHQGVTRLASQVGFPMVGVGWLNSLVWPEHARQGRAYAFVTFVLLAIAFIGNPFFGTIMAALGMAAVVVGAVGLGRHDAWGVTIGIAGALGVVGSGLLVNGSGSWGPFTRVAWFHLGLAASCWALAFGLRRVLGRLA
ncbi:MAG: hypothetical protein AAGA48_24180 [Myxococcota bacterium]